MKIFPYDTFTILIPDPLPVALQRLTANVEPMKLYRFSREHAPYQGTISNQSFTISRIIHHRNSFLPVIRGNIESKPQETAVHIEMSLPPFVMGFLGLWFLFWYGAIVPILFTDTLSFNFGLLFLGMPLIILVGFWFAFWSEANRSRKELTQILQGQIVDKLS
jgi:hypothetical protein